MLIEQGGNGRRRSESVELETGIDIGRSGPGSNHLRRRPVAQYRAQRVDDDRLAGSSLSGKRIQTSSELDAKLVHDGEVANFEFE